MSANASLAVWAGSLLCVLAPVALAHYGRSTAGRLGPRGAVGVVVLSLGTFATSLAVFQTSIRHFGEGVLIVLGITIGVFGLVVYGVLERLVLDRIPELG